MAKGGAAFGTGPAVEGLIAPTPPTPEDAIDALKEIAEKYCIPPLVQPRTFSLTALQAQKFDFFQSKVNALVITVTTGLVYVFLGDYSSGNLVAPQLPHIAVSAALAPQTVQIAIPMNENYTVTVQEAASSTAAGCITAMGL